MKNTFLTIIFFLLSLNSFSQNWIEVTKDKYGNKYYIKSTILSKGGDFLNDENVIKIWTKRTVTYLSEQRKGYKRKNYYNAYLIELIEYDCRNFKSKILSKIAYNSSGKAIIEEEIDSNFSAWEYIIPDSIGETIINKVCELYN